VPLITYTYRRLLSLYSRAYAPLIVAGDGTREGKGSLNEHGEEGMRPVSKKGGLSLRTRQQASAL